MVSSPLLKMPQCTVLRLWLEFDSKNKQCIRAGITTYFSLLQNTALQSSYSLFLSLLLNPSPFKIMATEESTYNFTVRRLSSKSGRNNAGHRPQLIVGGKTRHPLVVVLRHTFPRPKFRDFRCIIVVSTQPCTVKTNSV